MRSLKFTIFCSENDTVVDRVPVVLWGRDLQRPRRRQVKGGVGVNRAALRSKAWSVAVRVPAPPLVPLLGTN